MNDKWSDLLYNISSIIRVVFWFGLGTFLAMKAGVVIPQSDLFPPWLVYPAIIIAFGGGLLLAYQVMVEPTPKQQRETKRNLEILNDFVQEHEERY